MSSSPSKRAGREQEEAKRRLLSVIFPPQHQHEDLLSSLIAERFPHNNNNNNKSSTMQQVEEWLAAGDAVNWHQFVLLGEHKSAQVLASLVSKQTVPAELRAQIQMLALREAFARQLQQVLQQLDSTSVATTTPQEAASPFTVGARFDQLSGEMVRHSALAMKTTYTYQQQPEWMQPREWLQLAVLDAERAERMGLLLAQEDNTMALSEAHKHQLPAVLSICELLCCLPRELNFKLNCSARFSEVPARGGLFLMRLDSSMDSDVEIPVDGDAVTVIMMGWVFSRSSSAESRLVVMGEVQHEAVKPNTLVLHPVAREKKKKYDVWWMVCALFSDRTEHQ